MEPTRSTDPFCSSFTTTLSWNLPGLPWPCSLGRLAALATLFVPLEAQNGQKGSPKGLSAVPTITAATTATNCFTTRLSWNRPDLRTLFVPPLPPRFHGTYQVYLDRAVWAGWQLWRPFLFLLRPKTVKKGHQRVCQQYLLLPLLLLLLIALLPRFHGTDQIYGPFLFLLYHHAFMEPTRSTLTVQRVLSAVPTITAATTATNCFTTTLSWNRPDLRTLFVPPLPPRFHGTYQVYLDRAVWAGWQLWRPFLFLLRPKTVKKGHQRVCQQYLLLPLLLLLLIALLPRFHGTDQIYGPFLFLLYHHAFMEPTRSTLTVQFGPAGSSGDPFCSSWGPKRWKRVTKGSVSSTYYYRCYYCY